MRISEYHASLRAQGTLPSHKNGKNKGVKARWRWAKHVESMDRRRDYPFNKIVVINYG